MRIRSNRTHCSIPARSKGKHRRGVGVAVDCINLDDVDDGDDNENEMTFGTMCARPKEWHMKQDEMIDKIRVRFRPLLRQTHRNEVARSEMKSERKRGRARCPRRGPGAGKAGTFSWGAGESFVRRSSPAPLRPARSDPLFPCAKEVHTDTLAEATTAETPGPVVGVERQWIDCAETDFSEQSATLGP